MENERIEFVISDEDLEELRGDWPRILQNLELDIAKEGTE